MMAIISEYLAHKLLDHVFGRTAYTPPTNIFVRLFLALPDAVGFGGIEVSGGGYNPPYLVNNLTNFQAAAGLVKVSAAPIDFGTPSASWGTVVGVALADAGAVGNSLWIGSLGIPRVCSSGVPVSLASGGLMVRALDYVSVYAGNKLLDLVLGGQGWTAPETLYIKLFTTVPDQENVGGVEVSGGGYAALEIANNTTTFPNAANQAKVNAIAFNFGTPSVDWGLVAGYGYYDVGGNQIWAGEFTDGSRLAPAGTPFVIPAGGSRIVMR
jgi:hypothetical protein